MSDAVDLACELETPPESAPQGFEPVKAKPFRKAPWEGRPRNCNHCLRTSGKPHVSVCPACALDHAKMVGVYRDILKTYPSLRTLTMAEVFERMWFRLRDLSDLKSGAK